MRLVNVPVATNAALWRQVLLAWLIMALGVNFPLLWLIWVLTSRGSWMDPALEVGRLFATVPPMGLQYPLYVVLVILVHFAWSLLGALLISMIVRRAAWQLVLRALRNLPHIRAVLVLSMAGTFVLAVVLIGLLVHFANGWSGFSIRCVSLGIWYLFSLIFPLRRDR